MARDPETIAHQEWLGYVQPVGLVVSIPALLAAQCHINRNIAPDHGRFLACLPRGADGEPIGELRDFGEFTCAVLGWRESDLEPVLPGDLAFAGLEVALPEYHETLRPTHVVRDAQPKDSDHPWMILIQVLPPDHDLDAVATADDRHWQATPHAKFERLLRETQVPLGLICNRKQIRLVHAPRGETSGFMTFSVAEMIQVAGRPIFAALHMLLCDERLFSLGERQRLPAILSDSRKYQNTVSTQLAEQVLAALNELLRGFQAADDQRHGELLREVLAADPSHVYSGLLTVLLRLVFTLYAEDRNLLSSDAVYSNHYSVTGLFDRLRADAGRFPDTMDQRYGAWAQLLTLFRLIYEGGSHGELRIPARQGYLFDPDRYKFLEGRNSRISNPESEFSNLPRVSDGVGFRVLQNLLILDGERLSYRTLDVEQIGSVYEAMMGFELEVAGGRSIAIRPKKPHGAPSTINLEQLLATAGKDRAKWLKDRTEQALTGQAAESLKSARTIEDLLAAIDHKIARSVTPNVVSKGAMVFQPSEERRRSGSHYTPRSLTEPIVRTTLKPVLEQLGPQPKPEQLLDLKICDEAVGSGAFLVETCRQLGDELVKAWHMHDCVPKLPPDEDEVLHARRLIAQRCLYGVDRNPMAVDLAKLSLWLATLAKDHPFTFLDHSIRTGDSLVGLSRKQITGFHWEPSDQRDIEGEIIHTRIQRATDYRKQILQARDDIGYLDQSQRLALADESLAVVRMTGDLVIAAFFSADKDKDRRKRCDELFGQLSNWFAKGLRPTEREPLATAIAELRSGNHPITPFHWEIEFPEVFLREDGGFDAVVGNPPFAGRTTLSEGSRSGYIDWLKTIHDESHGNADLVAHFFRRAFNLIRTKGCLGLIATNTIGQGDTRSTGLRWICLHGGTIYACRKRFAWPGVAAVVISVVHVYKGTKHGPYDLDGRTVPIITAYLFHAGGHDDPATLISNRRKSFQGCVVVGMGFTFDDTDSNGIASPTSLMRELIQRNRRNAECVFPYIGGEEVNDSPEHMHHRFVINFDEREEGECRRNWPDLMAIVEEKVKPERVASGVGGGIDRKKRAEFWWRFSRTAKDLYESVRGLHRALVTPQTSNVQAFAFLPVDIVFGHTLIVFPIASWSGLAVLQSRLHQRWAAFLGPTMKDDLRYAPSDCFETFPFPAGVLEHVTDDGQSSNNDRLPSLENAGREYYEFRAALLIRNNEGLTKTYNRFHDPDERSPDIVKLRELHAAMDRAVLKSYGWHDLAQTATCEFLLDYEDEEEDDEPSGRRTRKKPWRYRWPDDFRDEVLARLLALNQRRAEEERLAGLAAKAANKKPIKKPRKQKTPEADSPLLP
jgi:N-6 DNA Methylase